MFLAKHLLSLHLDFGVCIILLKNGCEDEMGNIPIRMQKSLLLHPEVLSSRRKALVWLNYKLTSCSFGETPFSPKEKWLTGKLWLSRLEHLAVLFPKMNEVVSLSLEGKPLFFFFFCYGKTWAFGNSLVAHWVEDLVVSLLWLDRHISS